jgi:Outer membrane protein beta-barrel domain
MTKKKIATMVLCFITVNSFSQKTHLDLILNALTTNFNYGKSNSNLQEHKEGVWGAQVGASFQAGVTPKFSLVPEFYFIMKGGILRENNPLTTNKSTIRLYVLELPILARFHFNRFYFNTGPYLAYNLSGRLKTEGSVTISEKSAALLFNNSSEGFKRWDTGFQFGGGYIFPLKKVRIALDLKYCYGLTNISNGTERYNRFLNFNILVSKPWKTNPLAKEKRL